MRNNSLEFKWLILFLAISFLVSAFAAQFTPGEWYQGLQRAPWTPPNIAFPIVWTLLYCTIAVAGWQIFATQDSLSKQLWVLQLVLNGLWSWLFFGQHWMTIALLEIILLVVVVSALVRRRFNNPSVLIRWLLVPYLGWLILATTLNAYIVIFNH